VGLWLHSQCFLGWNLSGKGGTLQSGGLKGLASAWMMGPQVVGHVEVGVVEGTGKNFEGHGCLVCHGSVFH
jgi:hypothetical protein